MFTPRISALVGCDKSSGPDGYTAAFFKGAWEIVGSDVVNAVKEFFVNGKLLKELNHTVIALIPKIQNPTRINDFRPISCCNVFLNALVKLLLIALKVACPLSILVFLWFLLEHFTRIKELIEKVEGRINDWKNKSLSIAGRLQLIHSVIASLHVYWASMFVLPSRVLLDIEQSMRGFLWCQGKMRKGKSKVAWEDVCLPKNEGGLGVKRLDIFNKALMSSHIWKLLIRKDSLWVKWIHTYKLRNRNFWDFPFRGSMTWAWRKILQLRPVIREFIWYRLGNGHDISLWYDKWCSISPLADVISNRDLHRVGLTTMSKVRDIIHDGSLSWPADLEVKYPILNSTTYPHVFPLESDKLEWRFLGAVEPFSVSTVWKAIRPRDVKVTWSNVVWFSNCIPRHAFNLWLVMKRRLKTQDMLRSWDLSSSLNAGSCLLCSSQPDSHEHLFFECTRTSMSIVTKLILAASTYFIWPERNERLFNNQHRSANQVIECISASIRLKLISCRFKRSTGSLALLRRWKLPDVLIEQK
ncbi:auxin efflux carrier [Tanacetum coccineum]|uniref:Auxin efflux carrier n=1 Tax=Tanacetum coccineum TaxID=301880 RepID=A0ABQ5GGB2_9ASTR